MNPRAIKATKELCRSLENEAVISYGAACVVMWEVYGWRTKRILGVLDELFNVWNESAADNKTTMIKMLDEEAGIELQNGSGRSYKELEYLNGEIGMHSFTLPQYIYMRKRQITWSNTLVCAGLLLGLHRRYGFGQQRCLDLYTEMQNVIRRYNGKQSAIVKACREITNINIMSLVVKEAEERP